MIGVRQVTRKGGKQVYILAFSYRGVQCRETMALRHTAGNLAYCEGTRNEINRRIELGTFKYGDYFPDSKRAALFGQGPAGVRKLKVALEAYRERIKKTMEPSTYAGYRKAIDNVLVPWCGEKRIHELAASDIRDWVGLLTVSLKRIRNLLLPLRAVLDEAVADGLIDFNPLAKLKLAKLVAPAQRVSDFEPDPYTEAEVLTLLKNMILPERLAFQLWSYTGIRTGELIGLRWPRVDLEAGAIKIVETTTARLDKARPKTPAGVRTIPLLPAAREAIDLMRAYTLLGSDRVTVNPRSTRDDRAWDDKTLAKVWRAAHKGTGIRYRNPYQLRHSFASQLLSQGESLAYIARLLGHKTVEMVMRNYARFIEQGERLGFDRPPRQYGMRRLWDDAIHSSVTHETG